MFVVFVFPLVFIENVYVNTYLTKTKFNVRHMIDKVRSIDLVEILIKFRHSCLRETKV